MKLDHYFRGVRPLYWHYGSNFFISHQNSTKLLHMIETVQRNIELPVFHVYLGNFSIPTTVEDSHNLCSAISELARELRQSIVCLITRISPRIRITIGLIYIISRVNIRKGTVTHSPSQHPILGLKWQ